MPRKETPDIKKLRYVLYARKSTEDENRQVRSIDDQIKDCQKIANDLGLTVMGEPLKETKSAKKPGQRPVFMQMLKDIENKKYDAILCWHPDRLCRNMLEGGQVINMLDENVLKDIRFHSHQFSNDANGKMLLGMLFVFSKQYSEDLSDKVSRGVEGNLSEGKSSGSPKFGYERVEETGLYEPNKFHEIIKEAWKLRESGKSLNDVTKFLLDKNFYKETKSTKITKRIKPSLNTISNMFRDPFYYGLLVQTGQSVDLRQLYDFTPATTEEGYNKIQAMSYGKTQDKNEKKKVAFYPLRRMIFCAICNYDKPMSVGKNLVGSGTHHVLSYTCINKVCSRKPKSIRAKHIFNSVYEMLDKIVLSDEAYTLYSKQLDSLSDEKIICIREELRSKRGALAHITNDLNNRALNLIKIDRESIAYDINEKNLNELAIKKSNLEEQVEQLERKIANPNRIKLEKEEFLNLIKTLPDKMRAGSAVEKDVLCRILFLNLRVDNEKVAIYHWNEPFASLVKATELSSGGGGRN